MSYHIQQTAALVLQQQPLGDADKRVYLLTDAFGLTVARARGVREERSKLRYSVQEFSHARVSLVYGKHGWHITGAERAINYYWQLRHAPQAQAALVRVLRLVRRLLHDEEQNRYLTDAVNSFCDALVAGPESGGDVRALEHVTVLRIMDSLGYSAADPADQHLLTDTGLHGEVVAHAQAHRSRIVRAINHALHASHL